MTIKPSKYSFSEHGYPLRATWQPRLPCKVAVSFLLRSLQEPEELRCRYRDQSEHQMRHHLGRPAHSHEPSTIIVLQIRVDPLGSSTIPKAHRLRWIHLFLFSSPWVAIDDWNMTQCGAVGIDLRCVVGRVHQVVKTDDPPGGHLRQGDGYLRIMQRGRTQDSAYRNVPVDRIDMQFVAGPACFVPLGINLGTHIAPRWQISHVLCQAASRLQIKPLRFFCHSEWPADHPACARSLATDTGSCVSGLPPVPLPAQTPAAFPSADPALFPTMGKVCVVCYAKC